MSEGRDPHTGRTVAGIFLCLLGICMVALGGGCTILWLMFGTGGAGPIGPLLLLLCVGTFIGGVFAIRAARKMFAPPPDLPSVGAQPPPDA
jgi:drug/metabolite transporter (DMT)-like permease